MLGSLVDTAVGSLRGEAHRPWRRSQYIHV